MCQLSRALLVMGGICIFAVLVARVGMREEDFDRERGESFLSLYVLYPLFLWAGPPLLAAGGFTGLMCLL